MTSQIWLPVQACDALERAFGLTYDPTTEFYLVNDTVHERLLELNPTLTFKLGNTDFGGDFVNINLPYSAFDQQVSSPIYSSPTNYFPLRRAANATQYTLGRTFLQEAYVTVDYERSNFSVSQASFEVENSPQIVTINHSAPFTNSDSDSAKLNPSHTPSPRAIAGIVLGAVTVLIVTAALIFFLLRQRKAPPPSVQKHELDANITLERPHRPELEESKVTSGWRRSIKLNGETIYELP